VVDASGVLIGAIGTYDVLRLLRAPQAGSRPAE
jgi:hypothetical protein